MRFLFLAIVLPSLALADSPLASSISSRLKKVIASSGIPSSQLGVYVSLSKDGGVQEVYKVNDSRMMVPASLSKIVTAGVVLSELDPSTKFKTQLLGNTTVKDGTMNGSLYLKGFGDSGFVSESMWVLVNEFMRNRVQVIRGGIVVDDTWFDSVRKDSTRQGSTVDRAYAAPIGAMSFNWNSVNIYVRPGQKVGTPAQIYADPQNEYIRLRNQTRTVKSRKSSKISVVRKSGGKSFAGDIIEVKGQVSQSLDEKVVYKSITKPDIWSGYNLKAFLQQRGVDVQGDIQVGPSPMTAKVLAELESKPLSLLVRDMMKFSNNYVAEMLTKQLAAHAGTVPATMEKGIEILQGKLKSWGFDQGIQIYNPSGLTQENKLKAKSLHDLLRLLSKRFDFFSENLSAYPIAGVDGTLKSRMSSAPVKGWVRAKTGLLSGVSGLAGYAGREDGSLVTFVFLFNGSAAKTGASRRLFDEMATELVK